MIIHETSLSQHLILSRKKSAKEKRNREKRETLENKSLAPNRRSSIIKRLSTFPFVSSSPFRSYFPRNDARYHPLSRPFPFSFNPAPDLTPPPHIPLSLSLSLSRFVSFPTSHIHTPLFAHDKCAPFACRVSALEHHTLPLSHTRSNPPWSLSSVSLPVSFQPSTRWVARSPRGRSLRPPLRGSTPAR